MDLYSLVSPLGKIGSAALLLAIVSGYYKRWFKHHAIIGYTAFLFCALHSIIAAYYGIFEFYGTLSFLFLLISVITGFLRKWRMLHILSAKAAVLLAAYHVFLKLTA